MEGNMFEYSQSRPLVRAALNYRSLRQDLVASNIANVDTPMYRPKDVNFEQVLASKAQEIFDQQSQKKLELAHTHGYHLDAQSGDDGKATIFYRDGHMARNDGNSVDLDVETSEMGKNTVMYNALVNSLKKHQGIFKAMLDASAKI